jgi:hypothetical protein
VGRAGELGRLCLADFRSTCRVYAHLRITLEPPLFGNLFLGLNEP